MSGLLEKAGAAKAVSGTKIEPPKRPPIPSINRKPPSGLGVASRYFKVKNRPKPFKPMVPKQVEKGLVSKAIGKA